MSTLATHPEHTGRHDLPLSHPDLPLYRLYLMRAGYLLMGVGIAVVKWPQVISHGNNWPLYEGIVACILTAMSLLAFLGLRYPVKMLLPSWCSNPHGSCSGSASWFCRTQWPGRWTQPPRTCCSVSPSS